MSTNAVVLLSGGLDSATCLALAREQGYACHALSFRYGQRHAGEVEAARRVARALSAVQHQVLQIDLGAIGGSALTSAAHEVPKARRLEAIGAQIPITYVPARNTIFLSLALAWAEVLPAQDIFIGVNALDYSGYPDCRPAFISAFEELARQGTRLGAGGGRYVIHAPLLQLDKAGIIRLGLRLGVDYGLTTSCYDPGPGGAPCRACDACVLRARGFAAAGLEDPLLLGHRG